MDKLEQRIAAVEEALIGSARTPGMAELQRRQANDLQALKQSLDGLSQNVNDMVRARAEEISIRKGEQQMLRTFRNVAYALLIVLGGGGTVLGARIISALNGLR